MNISGWRVYMFKNNDSLPIRVFAFWEGGWDGFNIWPGGDRPESN
jgi:hypothetical protein